MDRTESTAILGEAPVFLEMLEHASQVAPLNKPVLVIGERGTGKELVARACTTCPRAGKHRSSK